MNPFITTMLKIPGPFKHYPAYVELYLSGILLYRALKRFDKNIFKVVRFLDLLKVSGVSAQPRERLERLRIIARRAYYLSPWMWAQRCLYESLLYYLYSPDKPTVNIGLRIDYNKTIIGHCWISVNGATVDKRDAVYASDYAEPFAHRKNIYYWLLVNLKPEKRPVLLRAPVPAPMLLKRRK